VLSLGRDEEALASSGSPSLSVRKALNSEPTAEEVKLLKRTSLQKGIAKCWREANILHLALFLPVGPRALESLQRKPTGSIGPPELGRYT
jgi:hypothetical protein